jgi:hypothetical protein
MEITREEAACMLYCKEYSDGNAAELLKKKIDDKKKLEVCYETNSLKSAFVPLLRIFIRDISQKMILKGKNNSQRL